MEILSNYWLLILTITILVSIMIFITIKVIRTEKRRNKWEKTIQLGDHCNVAHVGDSGHQPNLEIVEKGDDYVIVEMKVKRRWIYPPTP